MNYLKKCKPKICLAAHCVFVLLLTDDDLAESSAEAEMISSNIARDEEGLILPKKLINPCLESSDRQSLHKELLFNQKM